MVQIEKGHIGDSDCRYGSQEVTEVYVECDGCGKRMEENETLYEYNEEFYCAECLKEVVPCVSAKTLIEREEELQRCLLSD